MDRIGIIRMTGTYGYDRTGMEDRDIWTRGYDRMDRNDKDLKDMI